ncbi:MAG: tripartite tricarboxylate transporter substrate binding protein [Burkholderiaceae bacterium]|nr:tripartite tricarboxylate transporter substrate binding protein [Burkholderiaceae bacterium]
MQWMRRGAVLVLALGWALPPGFAQESVQRAKNVTLVVPFAAGGGTDTLARMVGAKLQSALGQTVVIENRPGANGAVASRSVLAQPGDGQTLLLGSYSTHVIAPLASKQNTETMSATLSEFTALGVISYAPLALAVNATSPHRTLAQFIDAAKAKQTTFATFGAGSSAHLLGEIIAADTQARLLHIPYKGSAPATTDLVGGHVDSAILTVAALQPFVATGTLRALAVSSKARVPAMPDAATFAESGHAGLADTGWFAVFVASKTPPAVVARLTSILQHIAADAEFKGKLVELGLEPVNGSAQDAQALWHRSIASARAILKKSKVELD